MAAVLPSSRSVQIGQTATAFATVINTGAAPATGCRLVPIGSLPIVFSYRTTAPFTNQATGPPDTPAAISPGAAQTFVFSVTPTAAFGPVDLLITFTCDNAGPAPLQVGLNSLLASATVTPVPDIVALAATASGDGIVTTRAGVGAFAVASINLGPVATITVSADTGPVELAVATAVCQTDPATGGCLGAPAASVTLQIGPGEAPTFGVFVSADGPVVDRPGVNRIFVRFRDLAGAIRGATSVAVRSAIADTGGGFSPTSWTLVPAASADFRGWQQTSYDPVSMTAVTFGGSVMTYQNDTWVTDLAAGVASQRRPMPDLPSPANTAPCSRDGHNLVYVPAWSRHVLLNGWAGGPVTLQAYPDCIGFGATMAAYDVASNRWDRRPVRELGGRAGAAAVLHPDTGHLYVYGGGWDRTPFVTTVARIELYAESDAQGFWGHTVTLRPAGAHPPHVVNAQNAMVWIPSIKRFLLMAGRGDSAWGAWLYDPAEGPEGTWTPIRSSAAGGVFPPYRDFPAVAYEPLNDVVVLVGGIDAVSGSRVGDTWAWNPHANQWVNLNTQLGVSELPVTHHTAIAAGDGMVWVLPQGAYHLRLDLSGRP